MLKRFLLLFLGVYLYCSQILGADSDILSKIITNPVIFQNRINRVIFTVSNKATAETFNNLLRAFNRLEEGAHVNFKSFDYDVFINFGNKYFVNFSKTDAFYDSYGSSWCKSSDRCFNATLSDDVETIITAFLPKPKQPCPSKLFKEYTLIVSDTCLPSFNILLDDLSSCSMNYRQIALLLPTLEDVDQCKALLNPLHLKIFNSVSVFGKINDYSDMTVTYQASMENATINLLALAPLQYQDSLLNFDPKIRNLPLCTQGPIVAYFQYAYGSSNNSLSATITVPMNFDNSTFLSENYQALVKKGNTTADCSFINNFFKTANAKKTEDHQYIFLFIQDPYPDCFDPEILWNNTNRHLEVVVLYNLFSSVLKGDYSKFILPSSERLNHLSFYKFTDGLPKFWNETSLCRDYHPKVNYTDARRIIASEISHGFVMPWWLLVVIAFIGAVLVFIILICIIRIRHQKSNASKSTKASSIISMLSVPSNVEHWRYLRNDKDVIIDREKNIGSGIKALVYEGYLTRSNLFFFNTTAKIAAKVPMISDDDHGKAILNELEALIILKDHTNILELKCWILVNDAPVIITELAEGNLLGYVQSLKKIEEKQCLITLCQVCKALKYVAENKLIHRDVACRNVLMFGRVAKLGDFGLCCHADKKGEFIDLEEHQKFSYRWLSLEALTQRRFSEKSDVWAFGILCYEVFTFGAVPYGSKTAEELVEFLENEERLPKPLTASWDIFGIMKKCWMTNPMERLSFKELLGKFEDIIGYGYLRLKSDNKW